MTLHDPFRRRRRRQGADGKDSWVIDRGVLHNRPIQANDRDVVMRYEEALFLTHSHHFFSIHDTHIQLTDYALFSATI